MARRGTKKALSIQQEEMVAKAYSGIPSASSGAAVTDAGDVRTAKELFECKYTGSPEKPLKSKPTLLKQMEKIADEAWEAGRDPIVALRFYAPESVLANTDGWVDFTVRLMSDDVARAVTLSVLESRGLT